jgi:hypothetical protein
VNRTLLLAIIFGALWRVVFLRILGIKCRSFWNLTRLGAIFMVQYICDFCQRPKRASETWILGFAAENIGVTAARRVITILPQWNEAKAVDYLAVHFCSEECHRNYAAQLIGKAAPTSEVVEEVAAAPSEQVVVQEYPGTKVVTRVTRRKSAGKKSGRRSRKAA